MISVVIPAYNHEKFIGPAIDSVLNQTWQDFELIVVDDGSTDKTAEVIKGYDDPRISYYHQENQDAYNTINRGISLAGGEYIAILNSDDVFVPNRLEALVEAQRKNNSACLFSDVIPIDENGVEFSDPEFGWNLWHQKNRTFYQECNDLYAAFLKGNFMVTTSNLFMTAEAAKQVGKFCSLRYLHDYDYIFRMMLAFPHGVHYLENEKLLYYRIHSGNTLSEAAITGREQDKEVIKRYLLAKIEAEFKPYVEAGCDRLVELEQELSVVRNELYGTPEPGIKELLRRLVAAVKSKIQKK